MKWDIGTRTIDLNCRLCIMGVLNITPDSFSDGSKFLEIEHAVDRALEMESHGADIIDIGGESTRPGSAPVPEEEELRRVLPVLEKLSGKLSVPVSVDTYKSRVAKEAILRGAEIINDISGFCFDPAMAEVAASAGVGVILTHTSERPAVMQKFTHYHSIIDEVKASLRQAIIRAEASGIEPERIVVDPGIGFGKSCRGNLAILNRLREFRTLERPILIGTSRKSFIGTVLNRPVEDRLFGTAATVALALANGASILRVHDVREMRDVADMTIAILNFEP